MYQDLSHNDLVSIIVSYQKRFAFIKDDLNAIYRCIEHDENLKNAIRLDYNGFSPDACLLNIDIACDLQSDDCFNWELYSNL